MTLQTTLRSFLWAAITSVILAGCSSNSRSYDDDDDDDDDGDYIPSLFHKGDSASIEEPAAPSDSIIPFYLNDRACYGLHGNVCSVTYYGGRMDGMQFVFTSDGRLVSRTDYSGRNIKYSYISGAKYECDLFSPNDNLPLRVDYHDRVREDIDLRGNGDFAHYRWTFDDYGRLSEAWSSISFYMVCETYGYIGDSPLPTTISISEGEGGFGADTTETYIFKQVDPEGNWTEAEVHTDTTISDETDAAVPTTETSESTSTVTRTITYY